MRLQPGKADLLHQLQKEIISLQGNGTTPTTRRIAAGLGTIESAFPDNRFPLGVVHEFVSTGPDDAAATNGFIAGLLHSLRTVPGPCLWVSTGRKLFPPALTAFGIAPERVLFVDVTRAVEALWAVEEALKCDAVAAVVGEFGDLSFTESRRLQLAVEDSRVTGFIHRTRPRTGITAAVTRWQIAPVASVPGDDLPGLGHPRWNVQLLRVRNGRPGSWQVEWTEAGFRQVPLPETQLQAVATGKRHAA